MSNQKTPWDLDVRVRERNLKKGILDQREVDKHLKELPDVIGAADVVTIEQPALDGDDEG